MKKLLSIAALFLAAFHVFGQDTSVDKGAGWIYFSDVPALVVDPATGSETAVNINGPLGTPVSFIWNRTGSAWERWYKFDQDAGAPTLHGADSMNAYLDTDSGTWYSWNGSAWVAVEAWSEEEIQDVVGAMFTGGTHTGVNINYDDAGGVINVIVTGGGGASVVDSLIELSDVSITSPADSAILIWDSGLGKWRDDVTLTTILASAGGISSVSRDTTLTGDGTPGDPLGLNQQGATSGQILKWSGSAWVPGEDLTADGDTSTTNELQYLTLTDIGTDRQIIIGTLTTPTDTITLSVDDGDSDATNERNTAFGLNAGDSLYITDSGGTLYADLSGFAPAGIYSDTSATNEIQTVDLWNLTGAASLQLSLSSDATTYSVSLSTLEESQAIIDTATAIRADIPSVISDLSDVNTSGANTNDILRWNGSNWYADPESGAGSTAVLSFASPVLSIVGSNSVDLSALDTQLSDEEVEDIIGLMLSGNTTSGINVNYDDTNGKIDFIVTGGGGSAVDSLVELGDVAITSPVDSAVLIWDSGLGKWRDDVSLSDLLTGGGGTDDQTLSISNDTLYIEDGNFVLLSPYLDNTNLTQEQVEDFAGGMVTGNTETLITVTYQDADGTIDYEVEANLSNYTNDAGFLTSEVDGSTTNEIQDFDVLSLSGASLFEISLDGVGTSSVSLAALEESQAIIDTASAIRADIPISISDFDDVDTAGVTANQILKWNGSAWAVGTDLTAGAGSGETNVGVSVGTGAAVYKTKSDTTLFFRSITGTGLVDVTENTNDVAIDVTIPGRTLTFGVIGNSIGHNATDTTNNAGYRFSNRAFAADVRRDSVGFLTIDTSFNGGAPLNFPPQFIGTADGFGIDRVPRNATYTEEIIFNYLDANPFDTIYALATGKGGESLEDDLLPAGAFRDSILAHFAEAAALDANFEYYDYMVLAGYPGEDETLEAVVLEFKDLMDSLGYTGVNTTWFMNDAPTSYTVAKWNSQVHEIVANNGQFTTAYGYQDSTAAGFDGVHPTVAEIQAYGLAAYKSIFEGKGNALYAKGNWTLNTGQDLSAEAYDGWVLAIDSALNKVQLIEPPFFMSFNWGDASTSTNITTGETIRVQGGTNGIDAVLSGNTITLNMDFSELGTASTIQSDDEFIIYDSTGMAAERVPDQGVTEWIQDWFANSFFIDGTNLTGTYDDGSNTYTLDATASGMTSFDFSDGTTPTTITNGETITVAGGINGVDVVGGGTNTLTVNLDFSELTGAISVGANFEFAGWDSSTGVESRVTDNVVQTWVETFTTNENIATANLTATGNRVFSGSSNSLTLSGFSAISMSATNNVTISTSSAQSMSMLVGSAGITIDATGGTSLETIEVAADSMQSIFTDGWLGIIDSNNDETISTFEFGANATGTGGGSYQSLFTIAETGVLSFGVAPTLDNTEDELLMYDATTGAIERRTVASLPGGSGDNLGDHTATTTLNMSNEVIDSIQIAQFNDADGDAVYWAIYEKSSAGGYDNGGLWFQVSSSGNPVAVLEEDGEFKLHTTPTTNNSNTNVLVYNTTSNAFEINTTISGGGGGSGTTEYYFIAADTSTTLLTDSDTVGLTLDTQIKADASFTHTVGNSQITLDSTGVYLLSSSIQLTMGTERKDFYAIIYLDTGGGWTLEAVFGKYFSFETTPPFQRASLEIPDYPIDATAGDKVKICVYIDGAADWAFANSKVSMVRVE